MARDGASAHLLLEANLLLHGVELGFALLQIVRSCGRACDVSEAVSEARPGREELTFHPGLVAGCDLVDEFDARVPSSLGFANGSDVAALVVEEFEDVEHVGERGAREGATAEECDGWSDKVEERPAGSCLHALEAPQLIRSGRVKSR
jgi:hypothetical protein